MLITKKNNNNHHTKTISFNRLIDDLECTGIKQNRINLNYRLLNHENIYYNDYTYFIKI